MLICFENHGWQQYLGNVGVWKKLAPSPWTQDNYNEEICCQEEEAFAEDNDFCQEERVFLKAKLLGFYSQREIFPVNLYQYVINIVLKLNQTL